jgi:tetratricopeptide (TPR) repeat protein
LQHVITASGDDGLRVSDYQQKTIAFQCCKNVVQSRQSNIRDLISKMGKPKQHTRPPKKSKHKPAEPETADDFQEAADREEDTGSKWRAGDSAKSGRAFVRALEVYDKGLRTHPTNFDLAYNKARLLLEITQQPALVEHIGLPLIDLLAKALEAHRYALKLNEESPDVLFNTAQVLTSLAEQLSEAGQPHHAIPLLQESLELLSSCLSRQEMLLEQQQQDFQDIDEGGGGVQLDPDERPASTSASDVSEQTALVEAPMSANDLLDTVHASLSSLTTLVPMVEQSALQTYGDMAHTLTEKRAPSYISMLPSDLQDTARFKVALDRAIFIAAFADAQYSFMAIDLDTYLQQLDAFEFPAKEQSAHALSAEAEARTEFALSAIENFQGSPDSPAQLYWKQLSLAQDLYTAVTKLETEEAKERKAHSYESKGNIELLRHRLASTSGTPLSESIQRSAKTLIQNAQTYFKGAAQLARADEDSELEVKAKQRWLIATDIAAAMYGVEVKEAPFDGNSENARGDIVQAIADVVDEGLIEMSLGEVIMRRVRQ